MSGEASAACSANPWMICTGLVPLPHAQARYRLKCHCAPSTTVPADVVTADHRQGYAPVPIGAQHFDRITHIAFRWNTAQHHLNLRLAFDDRINEFGPQAFMPVLAVAVAVAVAVAGATGATTAGRALAANLDAQQWRRGIQSEIL
jgi:hypothetical protein